MINGIVVLIHPTRPGAGDVRGLKTGGKAQSKVNVRPLVSAVEGRRTHNSRSADPVIRPRSRDEPVAYVAPLLLTEHRFIVRSRQVAAHSAPAQDAIKWQGRPASGDAGLDPFTRRDDQPPSFDRRPAAARRRLGLPEDEARLLASAAQTQADLDAMVDRRAARECPRPGRSSAACGSPWTPSPATGRSRRWRVSEEIDATVAIGGAALTPVTRHMPRR